MTYLIHQYNPTHEDYELENQCEALIDWLRMVSLMDQLSVIDAEHIRKAIAHTNYMVENRLRASSSIIYKKTRNIVTEDVEYQTHNARIVSMAPELSLATIGETIPIIEVPADLPYPTVKEMAFVLTQIGHMVMHREVPKHTIETMGDKTNAIPNIYAKGKRALTFCSEILRQSR